MHARRHHGQEATTEGFLMPEDDQVKRVGFDYDHQMIPLAVSDGI